MVIRRIYSMLLLVLGLTSFSFAQDGGSTRDFNATVNVSANLVQSIEIITVSNIRLRNFQPEQREVYISSINSIDAGHMIAIGNPNADIRIEYLPERILTQTNGDGVLRFTYEISANQVDNQSTSEVLLNDNRNLRFNENGRFFLWIGGRVNIENALPGAYEGEFTIEIEYI